MKFGFDWSSGFRGEDGRTTDDDGRTMDISSPCEPSAQVTLKIGIPLHTRVLLDKMWGSRGYILTDIISVFLMIMETSS